MVIATAAARTAPTSVSVSRSRSAAGAPSLATVGSSRAPMASRFVLLSPKKKKKSLTNDLFFFFFVVYLLIGMTSTSTEHKVRELCHVDGLYLFVGLVDRQTARQLSWRTTRRLCLRSHLLRLLCLHAVPTEPRTRVLAGQRSF